MPNVDENDTLVEFQVDETTHILYKKGWKGNDIESGTAEYT